MSARVWGENPAPKKVMQYIIDKWKEVGVLVLENHRGNWYSDEIWAVVLNADAHTCATRRRTTRDMTGPPGHNSDASFVDNHESELVQRERNEHIAIDEAHFTLGRDPDVFVPLRRPSVSYRTFILSNDHGFRDDGLMPMHAPMHAPELGPMDYSLWLTQSRRRQRNVD